MPLQLNIWLLLAGALQGLLLSIVLIRKKTYRHGYGFLIAYLLLLLAQIFFKVADKHWLMEGLRNTYFLSYKFPLLYGPLTWLFAKYLLEPSKALRVKEGLHFLPFIISVVLINLEKDAVSSSWIYWLMEAMPATLLQIASIFAYHFFAWRLWKLHNQQAKASLSEIPVFQIRWLRTFILASMVIGISICMLTYFIFISYPEHNWLRFGFLLLCVFIYWVSYSVLQQPSLFLAPGHENNSTNNNPIPQLPAFVLHRPQKKYAHSNLDDEDALKITTGLAVLMQDNKIYTDARLTIDVLAEQLDCNRYVLSQVLNERLQQNFYEYINSWRVEAAKAMLLHPDFSHYKIASVGYEAGFNSLSTFNDVFKKRTGLSPSRFKNQESKEKSIIIL
jgi:AraC-like DNA-binding protein